MQDAALRARVPLLDQPHLPELLSAEQAALILGMSRDTLTRRARLGQLPAVHLGRRIFFSRRALVTFLKGAPPEGCP